ncbi:hypothetical protein [Corynebacterium sp. HMSC073D01]|uniref:YkvI family membrane protein n=1 Tax=Corynebacterium sp. HMSC073D01 TaxID=1739536 RepID=UPI0008A55272|nr:hypothetical protein [Corynebacterium sp. HMSC073D01]OFO45779.1 hypothetical protein HMPREF3044_01590 [Corynebacterium sp. HMSC073D01]
MIKRALAMSMAFLGVLVGAGFASGQEILQYFGAFGHWGIAAAVISGLIMMISGMVTLQFCSYFQSKEHMPVVSYIASPFLAKFFDYAIMLTLFATGFVMLAGAGSNLNQQFGLPTIAGSVLMVVLVIAVGFLDVDKVSNVIGIITPFLLVFMVIIFAKYAFSPTDSIAALDAQAASVQAGHLVPNWWVSSANYVGMCLMVGISMALIMGGNSADPKAAGLGGIIGGALYGLCLLGLVLSLYFNIGDVGSFDMPTLALVSQIHPVLGTIMAIVIYAMIFNTAIAMFYALSKRLSAEKPENFRRYMIGSTLIGFVFSFIPFSTLVSWLYPLVGYVGILLIVTLIVSWVATRPEITEEGSRREKIRRLVSRRLDPRARFTSKQRRKLRNEVRASNVEDKELYRAIEQEEADRLDSDDDVEFSSDEYFKERYPEEYADGEKS